MIGTLGMGIENFLTRLVIKGTASNAQFLVCIFMSFLLLGNIFDSEKN